MAKTREFWDTDRPVMDAYYDLITESGKEGKDLEEALKKIIEKDEHFLDPYTVLFDYYRDNNQPLLARMIITDAYEKSIDLITDKKGNWPDLIEWGYLENRHILRAMCNYGIQLWIDTKKEEVLKLFRKLLKVCPNDNVGTRYLLLGVLTGLDYDTFYHRFEDEDGSNESDWEWFEKEAKKFKTDFSVYL